MKDSVESLDEACKKVISVHSDPDRIALDYFKAGVEWQKNQKPLIDESELDKIANDFVTDGHWGYPVDKAGQFMYDLLLEYFKAGYKVASLSNEGLKFSLEDIEKAYHEGWLDRNVSADRYLRDK